MTLVADGIGDVGPCGDVRATADDAERILNAIAGTEPASSAPARP